MWDEIYLIFNLYLYYIIHLANKVSVLCSPLGNVAYNKSTVQTADYSYYTSDRAVDGITDYPRCAGTVADEAWWRVDLGQLYRIYSVTVYTVSPESELITLYRGNNGSFFTHNSYEHSSRHCRYRYVLTAIQTFLPPKMPLTIRKFSSNTIEEGLTFAEW